MSIEEEVIEIIAGILKVPADKITMNTAMEELSEWDSMRNIMILSTLESHFALMFPEDDIFNLVSVRSIVEEIQKLKA